METFYSFASSIIGQSHLDKGSPLQDASKVYEDERCSVIVVSDGHGSENFPRSDRGSEFACTVAVEAVREFLAEVEPAQLRTDAVRDATISQLCKNILLRWNNAVLIDATREPFKEEEVVKVKENYRRAYLNGEAVVHAYGATLLLVVLTRNFFLAVRNGDGECVAMDAQGNFTTPVPKNDKNEASFVTSLCDEDAIEDFRYFYTEELPAAVMLCSDGVENSYVHLDELFSLYRNVCRKAAHESGPATKEEVVRALPVITARGSGDDVSIACCLNLAQLQELVPVLDQAAAKRREQLSTEKAVRQCRALEPVPTEESKVTTGASAPENTLGLVSPATADDFISATFPELQREDVSGTTSVAKKTVEVGTSVPLQCETFSSNDLAHHPPTE